MKTKRLIPVLAVLGLLFNGGSDAFSVVFTVPFYDDFTGGAASDWYGQSGTWGVSGGVFQGRFALSQDPIATLTGSSSHTYQFEADIALKSGATNRNALLIFGYQNNQDYYFLGGFRGAGYWSLGKMTASGPTHLQTFPGTIDMDVFYHLGIEVNNRTVTGYLNGRDILQVTLASVPAGLFGVGGYRANLDVDHVSVEQRTVDESLSNWTSVSGSWAGGGGSLCGTSDFGSSPNIYATDSISSGAILSGSLSVEAGNKNRNAFFTFGYQNPQNYLFVGNFLGRNEWAIGRVVNGNWTTLRTIAGSMTLGVPKPVNIRFWEETMRMDVDGGPSIMYQFPDRIPYGEIGATGKESHLCVSQVSLSKVGTIQLPVNGFFANAPSYGGYWYIPPGSTDLATDDVGHAKNLKVSADELGAFAKIECDIIPRSGGTFRNAFMTFGLADPDDFYYAGTWVGRNTWELGRYQNGTFTALSTVDSPSGVDQPFRMEILLNGYAAILRKGNVVAAGHMDRLAYGPLGFFTRMANARWSNYSVKRLDTMALPYTEGFASLSNKWYPISGNWSTPGGVLTVAHLPNQGARMINENMIRRPVKISCDLQADAGGRYRNVFMIFGYRGPRDFYYAGTWVGRGNWEIGHYDGSFNAIQSRTGTTGSGTFFPVEVWLEETSIRLKAGGTDFTATTPRSPLGWVGFATHEANASYDNLSIQATP